MLQRGDGRSSDERSSTAGPTETHPVVQTEEQMHGWHAVGAGVAFGLLTMFKDGFFSGLVGGAIIGAAATYVR